MPRDRDFFLAVVLGGLSLTACGSEVVADAGSAASDAGTNADSGMLADAGALDAGALDAGNDAGVDADVSVDDAGSDAFVAIL